MSINRKKFGASLAGMIILVAIALFLFSLQNEIPGPVGWPSDIKIYRRAITGETRVVDPESGKVIFTYRPEYDRNIHPVRIEKIDADHWQVIFEAPKKQ